MSFRQVAGVMCVYFVFIAKPAKSQTENDPIVEQIIESIAENVTEDFDYSELTERLNVYRRKPLNINKATSEQLQELIFLSPIHINALLAHRKENGPFLDLTELQSIDGFDQEIIRKLINFVSIGTANTLSDTSLKSILNKGNHDLMVRYGQLFQKQLGFTIPDSAKRSRYLGSSSRLFTRYRYYNEENISASLNMEKDAGEQFFSGSKKSGFDFYSANLYVKNIGKLSKLVLGDYSLQFGQGLSLWSGLGFGKGSVITTLAKQDLGLRPYTSVNETSFFRGVAATINLKNLAFTPFMSYQKIDASLTAIDTLPQNNEITSLGLSGLHRTQTELSNKKSVTQLVYGSAFQYNKNGLRVGFTTYHTSFSRLFEPGKYLYNQFEFAGKSLTNLGLHYNYVYKNTYFFGEAAHSLGSGYAFVNGMVSSITSQVSVLLLHRNYQRNYQSFYNQGLSEASTAVNEKGFYSGLTIKPNSKWEFTTYADYFRFPWLKFRVDAPSKGHELFSQLTYTHSKKLKVSARYKLEEREENDDLDNSINTLERVLKQNYRLELSYKVNKTITLRNRLELAEYQKGHQLTENGYLMYQDVIYDPLQSRFSGNIRFAIFDTQGFNSRIYAYENDVLYGYSVVAHQNRGLRYYINGRYTLKRGVDVWLRYSITNYINQQTIGSGLDLINGHIKSDMKLQIRYQF